MRNIFIKILSLKFRVSVILGPGDSELYKKILRLKGVQIGDNVVFRNPASIEIDTTRPDIISIGNNVDINKGFTLLTHDFGTFVFRNLYHDFVNSCGKVSIGNNVVIGQNVTILKGVSIGDNCIIGLGSVITKSVPSNSVVVGAPAKVLCSLDEYYKKRKEKSLEEALEYGVYLYNKKGDDLSISDFTEEWCHFMTKEDYESYEVLRNNVDWRLKGHLQEFLSKERTYCGYKSFIAAIKQRVSKES